MSYISDMNYDEYKEQIKEIDRKSDLEKRELARKYANEHNPYKQGDIVTDRMGSIEIESIQISLGNSQNPPCCVYNGIILNKDGSHNKKGKRRGVWQFNLEM